MVLNNLLGNENRKGQVTIFIIVAIVIAGIIILYFTLDFSGINSIPEDLKPAYDYYISCIEEHASQGISLLGEQGGYIDLPSFERGSSYRPFSSQLDFLGQGIPYWMYVSGNNVVREQVPTRGEMQDQLNKYVSDRLEQCDFSALESAGYDFYFTDVGGETSSIIGTGDVRLNVKKLITLYKGESTVTVDSHEIKLNSKLGKFYDMALKVYNHEMENSFLEKYAIDVMRLYAPVTGVEISCVPKIFIDSNISSDIANGLEANIGQIKLKGDYYTLSSKERNYYVADAGFNVDENVNFMYSSSWPTRIEIYGDKVVEPVGLQEGLGILGFCYVPYHLVYDIDFPVLVQFYDEKEIFQFPVSVIISKSRERQALTSSVDEYSLESEVCKYKNKEIEVHTYDVNLEPVEAQISFKCISDSCDIGRTKKESGDSILLGKFPTCSNGVVVARAEGYADSKTTVSTNSESRVDVILNKKYGINLDLGSVGKALINFNSDGYSTSVLYPDTKYVELIEGYYNVSVQAYDNSSLKLPETKQVKCVDVAEGGIGGMFGLTKEKCFDVVLPEMDISFAVTGGGITSEYFTEGQLSSSRELNINVPLFGVPRNLDDLYKNSQAVENEVIYLNFE